MHIIRISNIQNPDDFSVSAAYRRGASVGGVMPIDT